MRILSIFAAGALCAGFSVACQIVDADNITGKDLASADAQFAGIDPELKIALAPSPGAVQVMRPEELAKLVRLNELVAAGPFHPVCFQRATEALTQERLMPVLRQSLAIEDAEIEILDFSKLPVPHGTLDFHRENLTPAGLWRGRVLYSRNQSAPVWVKVRVTQEQTWIESAAILQAGKPIEAAQIVVRKEPRFPLGLKPLDSSDLAVGRAAIRSIRPGTPLYASMLESPREIERGDTVMVEVTSGAATLVFDAVAESPGRSGESILVRNPVNGRFFRVRVEGRGKVSVKV